MMILTPVHFRGFISTEIAVRALKRGLRYLEVPVGRTSRGLRLRAMPGAVMRLLADSWALRRELLAVNQGRDPISRSSAIRADYEPGATREARQRDRLRR